MSIVPLARISIVGPLARKQALLGALQALGCVHIEPIAESKGAAPAGPSQSARRALRFLEAAPAQRHQAHNAVGFDANRVEQRVLAIEDRLRNLEEERRFLQRRIRDLSPWGNFDLPDPEERLGLRLWFYIVPQYLMARMPLDGIPWQVVHRDNRFCYVVALAAEEPCGIPVPRTHTGSLPLADLEQRLEDLYIEEDDLQAERMDLSRWRDLLAANIARLEDEAALAAAASRTLDDDCLFVVSGWIPAVRMKALGQVVEQASCAFIAAEPDDEAAPPTMLSNRGFAACGQDLLSIYMTPGYRTWDPSLLLAGSFCLFFGLILADVGYGLALAAVTGFFWRTLDRSAGRRRLRALLLVLSASAATIGILMGSYFGAPPPAGSILLHFQTFGSNDTVAMMELSAAIGVLHIGLGNFVAAGKSRGVQRLAPMGWILVLAAGVALYAGKTRGIEAMVWTSYAAFAVGGICVIGFSGAGQKPWARATTGLLSVAKLSAAFGDVLSYLRLFALGFAGTSLALAFNELAAKAAAQLETIGLLTAAVILIVGHSLNFALGIAGGFVHGLRLNFIEFFNWSAVSEGRPFVAFQKREVVP